MIMSPFGSGERGLSLWDILTITLKIIIVRRALKMKKYYILS